MVFLFHIPHLANLTVPEPFIFISRDFGYGVFLFFVISAFSLMHSTGPTVQRTTWAFEYFLKRFWRIAPLFYTILAVMILVPLIKSQHSTVDLITLLMNITFVFGLAPWKGVVWAGWTIGVEMLFYVFFPVLLLTIRTYRAAWMLLIFSLLASYAFRVSLHEHYNHTVSIYGYNWSYFSFGANFYFFALGIYAFHLTSVFQSQKRKDLQWLIPWGGLILLGGLLFTELDKLLQAPGRFDLMLWGAGFALLCSWQAVKPCSLLASRVFEYVGERSYSIYLLHPLVIIFFKNEILSLYQWMALFIGTYAYFICAALLLIPLLLSAELTYRFIEVPGIRIGKQMNNRIKKQPIEMEAPPEISKELPRNA